MMDSSSLLSSSVTAMAESTNGESAFCDLRMGLPVRGWKSMAKSPSPSSELISASFLCFVLGMLDGGVAVLVWWWRRTALCR